MKNTKIAGFISVIVAAVILAFNYYIFIINNHFAPAGLNGIATMVQYKTGLSISYMSLLINIPLSVAAYFLVRKEFAVKTLIFSTVYSVVYLLLQKSGLESIQYNADGHDTIYPVIISGMLGGIVYGVCFRSNASTGGTDIISAYINKIRPQTNFFIVTFCLNAVVALTSIFVYSEESLNYKPAALCIFYCFLSNFVGDYMLKISKTAYKFTIITSQKEALIKEIRTELRHGCTEIDATGTYTGERKSVLICVINKHQLYHFQQILARHIDTFSYFEVVNETYGNFKQIK